MSESLFKTVPREPDPAMHAALSEFGSATIQDHHERDLYCFLAIKAWRLMWDASTPAPASAPTREAVPDGWVLVPVEPTHEMIRAGRECMPLAEDLTPRHLVAAPVYRAMLAAAPTHGGVDE